MQVRAWINRHGGLLGSVLSFMPIVARRLLGNGSGIH
jgi:hypothetical protein